MGTAKSNGGNGGTDYKWVGTRQLRPDGVDKVTGRAKFGADLTVPNMLFGKVLRSPHAHARIKSIDTSKAEALQGVKAVITAADFKLMPTEPIANGEMQINYRDVSHNVMARGKVLYDGHAVAAVAATDALIAEAALALIEVDYEVLPHVIDVVEAMADDAPILHDDMFTDGVDPKPANASNIAKRIEVKSGDVEAGFAAADIVIEREFNTAAVHQGYIEPHACVANVSEDGSAELWCSTQGHFVVRANCARLLDMDISKLRVTSSEIGGGFGGKTVIYLEPLALALSGKAGKAVKMTMTREEVFRATGPTSGANMTIRIGATKDGILTAGTATLNYQAGAFAGSPIQPGAMCAFAPYDMANVHVTAYDVVTNRPKVAAYRAPGAPISEYGVESIIDEIAGKLGIDPVEFRLKNAAKEGTRAAFGPKFGPIGLVETLEAVRDHDHYKAPLKANQGRGVASGFWFNIGGETCISINVIEDGSVTVMSGTPDIGGSRASLCLMVAESLGVDYDKVRPIIADTASIGYTFLTGGSRATFSNGLAAAEAAGKTIDDLRSRAAKIWDIPIDAVEWVDGEARPAGSNAGEFDPLSLADLAKAANKTGGPIAGHAQINAQGAAPSFGTHLVDVEVDPETGRVTILRYTVAQDAGKAIHPGYVEGQFQGGAVQGVGWALNEEYIYDKDGKLENAGFLDYRIPVASDVPMIDTIIIEIPNPRHPFGVRGIGETPIIPPMAAIANAITNATNIRFEALPMSPPKVLAAIEASNGAGDD
ncbi:MAG: 4-hydroxybenzoyl-CoA reductase subunit alpha [Alphaproteobacteria bacterium MarineAlpha10_Bin3]|nr:MAG: 4-hydroxybenzoyl-CoA reductase subunit alpha [Alphaproteobacteria bacterium MarineAlpha10_Bin3]PPR74762.1 MAG: 4-hydroxybenzoyl-CoA reductase subunit alpha [Alphaproteobacteria bacterium MarineAlpha4_Bin1]